jgi:hypothetical protein
LSRELVGVMSKRDILENEIKFIFTNADCFPSFIKIDKIIVNLKISFFTQNTTCVVAYTNPYNFYFTVYGLIFIPSSFFLLAIFNYLKVKLIITTTFHS